MLLLIKKRKQLNNEKNWLFSLLFENTVANREEEIVQFLKLKKWLIFNLWSDETKSKENSLAWVYHINR